MRGGNLCNSLSCWGIDVIVHKLDLKSLSHSLVNDSTMLVSVVSSELLGLTPLLYL